VAGVDWAQALNVLLRISTSAARQMNLVRTIISSLFSYFTQGSRIQSCCVLLSCKIAKTDMQ
jgi:hypothetical protein